MNHNAYAIKGTYSPCYSTLKVSHKNTIIKKAQRTGYLIYNTIEDACTCDACKAAAESEGTEMGAYFKLVREIAAQDVYKRQVTGDASAKISYLRTMCLILPPRQAVRLSGLWRNTPIIIWRTML